MSDFDHLSDDQLKELGLMRPNPDGSDPLGRVALCCEDGCGELATTTRPEGMVGDVPLIESVCDAHAPYGG